MKKVLKAPYLDNVVTLTPQVSALKVTSQPVFFNKADVLIRPTWRSLLALDKSGSDFLAERDVILQDDHF